MADDFLDFNTLQKVISQKIDWWNQWNTVYLNAYKP